MRFCWEPGSHRCNGKICPRGGARCHCMAWSAGSAPRDLAAEQCQSWSLRPLHEHRPRGSRCLSSWWRGVARWPDLRVLGRAAGVTVPGRPRGAPGGPGSRTGLDAGGSTASVRCGERAGRLVPTHHPRPTPLLTRTPREAGVPLPARGAGARVQHAAGRCTGPFGPGLRCAATRTRGSRRREARTASSHAGWP